QAPGARLHVRPSRHHDPPPRRTHRVGPDAQGGEVLRRDGRRLTVHRGSSGAGVCHNVTRRILSSFGPGVERPSVLLVAIHSAPSGATATSRMRPYLPTNAADGLPVRAPFSGT